MVKPPRNASDEHEFYTLTQKPFEHFARALHEAQPDILSTIHYGPDGQKQFGADHIAFRSGTDTATEVGQSKAMRNFGPRDIVAAADAFLNHWLLHWSAKNVKRFILFVGCAIKSQKAADAIIEQRARFLKHDVEFIVWDANAIYDRLGSAPQVVRIHLDQIWYAKLFGETAGPLTGLQQDLQRGDFSALSVAGYVTRLNAAEDAEILELKRRARAGETKAVIRSIEESLAFAPVAAASTAAVRAQKLRLLAGLLLSGNDYNRIKALLDEADGLDGNSTRHRAMLAMDSLGAEAVLDMVPADAEPGLAEVRAVALLRLRRPDEAFQTLEPHLAVENCSAETQRVAALAELVAGRRTTALGHARAAAAKDSGSRACKQTLAITLFQIALSPAAEVGTGEWPQPVDQPLVLSSDEAKSALEESFALFKKLVEDETLAEHRSMLLWQFGVLACMPWRRNEAEALIATLEAEGRFLPPMAAWAMARGLSFDSAAAATSCDCLLTEDPSDFETLLIRVGLANFNREFKKARAVLEQGRAALEAAGHGDLYHYWSAVLAVECKQDVSAETLAAHPWLRLRTALDIRKRRPRLHAIAKIMEAALADNGDPRVLLAATQYLLDGGWHNGAVKAAPVLVERIGSAEAISVAAHAFYRTGRYTEALAALARTSAFPGQRLPLDLERLRANCLAASGDLVLARETSVIIARKTGQAADLWQSIEFQIASGAAPAALALYREYADLLDTPAPGHINLARAVLHFDPAAAAQITKQVAAMAPDNFVTAVFDLAAKLRLADEQRDMMKRISQLGAVGGAGVWMFSFEEVREWIAERSRAIDEAAESYRLGHMPVHLLTSFSAGGLAASHLGRLLDPPPPGENQPTLSNRYGRRYDADLWPENRDDLRLYADVTALLTAQGLDLLDTVERAAKPIHIATDAVNALSSMRADIESVQPERIDAARHVLARLDDGDLVVATEAGQLDSFTALWEIESGEPASTLNFSKLFETIAEQIENPKRLAELQDQLAGPLAETASGPSPARGAILNLDAGIAETLEECGALLPLVGLFILTLAPGDVERMRRAIADADARARLVASLTALIKRIASGLDDGTYKTVPLKGKNRENAIHRSLLQIAPAAIGDNSIFWVDDRYISAIDHPDCRIMTTVEVLGALVRYERLTDAAADSYRQRLRAARWIFMPAEAAEIARALRPAVSNGSLVETGDLATLRRAMATTLLERRALQWPSPEQAQQELKGEVPFLLETGHSVTGALAEIWNSRDWTIEDAEAATGWLLDNLEIELFPPHFFDPRDPRGDTIIGVYLASLLLVALQILPKRAGKGKKEAYISWIWGRLIRPALHVRPEQRPQFLEMMEHHLTNSLDGSESDAGWLQFVGETVNMFPVGLRASLFERPAIVEAFTKPDYAEVSIDAHSFEELAIWGAIAGLAPDESVTIETVEGKQAEFTLRGVGDDPHLQLLVEGQSFRVDAWPWRVAHGDTKIRREALHERQDHLDLSQEELDRLADTLGTIDTPAQRVQEALRRSHASLGHSYADLAAAIELKAPLAIADFGLPDYSKLSHYLRLGADDGDWNGTAGRLLADRGLAVAVTRLGGLPIRAPQPICDAVAGLDDDGARELIDAIGGELTPPWIRLFIVPALLKRDRSPELCDWLRAWVVDAVSDDWNRSLWETYVSLARYASHDGPGDPGWRELDGRTQLAFCWGHAASIANILVSSQMQVRRLTDMLDENRSLSPRALVETVNAFPHDRADPRQCPPERLMLYAAARALEALPTEGADERLECAWKILLREDEDGIPHPRLNIVHGELAPNDRLDSFFNDDVSALVDSISPGAGVLFDDGLKDLIRTFLNEPVGTRQQGAAWSYLRMACGDGPLPDDIAVEARERALSLDLADPGEDASDARALLMSVTVVASSNAWTELGPALDTAAIALCNNGELSDRDMMLMLEISMWRARLEGNQQACCDFMGAELLRLGSYPALADKSLRAAQHFSRSLAGQLAQPFIDTLATLRIRE